jgi:ribose transport system ATP-binding protein
MPTRGGRFGVVDYRSMNERAARLLSKLAPEIDVQAPLGTLAPGRRQIVQIAASLDERAEEGGSRPRIIVFDEPTSSLSMGEADRLMKIVRDLASQGLLCIYVSHRMGEIFQCCDRITILRDGKFVATSVIKQISEREIVSQMIGRTIDTSVNYRGGSALAGPEHHAVRQSAGPMLVVKGLSSPGKLNDISLSVKPGEVLGVGGLVGSGRSELLDAIFGLDARATGEVKVGGQELPRGQVRAAISAGMGYVPEDRRLQGLFFLMGIDENIAMPQMPLLAKLGLRGFSRERELVGDRVQRFQVKAAGFSSLPGELSGGNQQKLLIARWMSRTTKVLLLDEPTRGIDVGTKTEVYKLVRQAADEGLAVLLVSSEMPELLALSDRIAVMCEGELTGELSGDEMTQERIMQLATRTAAV